MRFSLFATQNYRKNKGDPFGKFENLKPQIFFIQIFLFKFEMEDPCEQFPILYEFRKNLNEVVTLTGLKKHEESR